MTASEQILINEQHLFTRMSTGDQQAFTEIFYHYFQRIHHFILKKTKSEELTEEIIQEVFISVWEKREKFSAVENFEDYLFSMAANRTWNFIRRLHNEKELKQKVWRTIEAHQNSTEDLLDLKESQGLINEAVEQLSPQRKKIFILSRQQGLSHTEIAEQLNLSPSTVNNHLTEALRFIKEYLQRTPGASITLLMILLRINN
jgi:RNA polymerase sigma-70 factor (ECF subfamily)